MNLITLKIGDSYLGEDIEFSNALLWLNEQVITLSPEETKAYILGILENQGLNKEQTNSLIALPQKYKKVLQADIILRILLLCELIKDNFFNES